MFAVRTWPSPVHTSLTASEMLCRAGDWCGKWRSRPPTCLISSLLKPMVKENQRKPIHGHSFFLKVLWYLWITRMFSWHFEAVSEPVIDANTLQSSFILSLFISKLSEYSRVRELSSAERTVYLKFAAAFGMPEHSGVLSVSIQTPKNKWQNNGKLTSWCTKLHSISGNKYSNVIFHWNLLQLGDLIEVLWNFPHLITRAERIRNPADILLSISDHHGP